MNLTIHKIRLKELEAFINSRTFRHFEYVPISHLRAKSYLSNPRSNPDDVVLYLGFIDEQLVAFRSLFADVCKNGKEKIRFGWCSGAWVHPNFRRKGFSEQLLKEAYSDWNKKLMFTNYTTSSEKLIKKTGWFKTIYQFEGARAYLFPKTRKLIAKADSNLLFRFVFLIIDLIVSGYSNFCLWIYPGQKQTSVRFETGEFPDKECYQLIGKNTSGFNRGENELKWIFNHPWLSTDKSEYTSNYPFSSYTKYFYYKTVKLYSENKLSGFFIFSVREGHLKTLYFHLPDELLDKTATFLKNFSKENKIEFITIYKKALAAELFKRKFPFLHVKKYGQKIYGTFEIISNTDLHFQDGEGDVFFT
ncbi:hypothetical protein OU798_20245 [Prolixibacteraceae bacterium Z1-6]|uniref:N-acetyltransferase domain-containing protein n=1 Tax=Draconibacterium aestuarii TaxID=2998507 RepID=A0A9X3FA71_9BACT|nr:hypothetical protein [Prolixibacteraceae bacterium Z1-6]